MELKEKALSMELRGLSDEDLTTSRGVPVRLLIVSDVRFVREGLAELLAKEKLVSISGQFGRLDELLSKDCLYRADIVLIDKAFPDALTAIGRIRTAAPRLLVVVIAVRETAEEIISWAEAGVAGYIPRTAGLADIVPLLVEIRLGKQPCLSSVAAGLLRRLYNGSKAVKGLADPFALRKLTVREAQIARLITAGLSNKDIARQLNIGVATAKTHVHNLLKKLNLQRRGQTTLWVHEQRELLRAGTQGTTEQVGGADTVA
jgi:DNA-binding NarL/FixJ family response regulator